MVAMVVLAVASVTSVFVPVAHADVPGAPYGDFTPLTPARVLDTRGGPVPEPSNLGPVGPGAAASVSIAGQGGVPADGVSAVVLNVTAVAPTAAGYLTVWPSGTIRPEVSSVNFVAGQIVAAHVTVALGVDGKVAIYNFLGSTDVVIDVMGFYSSATGPVGGRYRPATLTRVVDSRIGLGVALRNEPPNVVEVLDLTAQAPAVAASATAVVLNVTLTQVGAPGFVTVYPDDGPTPLTSSLNVVAGDTRANLVTVRVPASKRIAIASAVPGQLIVDLVGSYQLDHTDGSGRFVPIAPSRQADTRTGWGPIEPGWSAAEPLGRSGVPATGVQAVMINLTVTEPTAAGYLVVHSLDNGPNDVSSINYRAGETVANAWVAQVAEAPDWQDRSGIYVVTCRNGETHFVIDAFGWFTGAG